MQTKTTALIRPALTLFVALSLATGLLYPFAATGLARVFFPEQAAGSLVERHGQAVGSRLIGQYFSEPRYFWGRPSATAPMAYNGASSGGSNLGPTNPALAEAARARAEALRQADPGNPAPIPVDLLTASGSGLDPHISPEAARYQAARVARERGLPLARVQALIDRHVERPWPTILGQPVVNVLALNLALDAGV
ncbi:potassium-transporting ATPase subunit KdpC [Bordetella pseudohinzii]|uniref:Potassium-transporting ATPase KdpC subunit n=1 Tax=Bordetella pseudohinzii TaxID=1331258 RepID=A0A0J6BUS6_9BORD|nr:potassium-transporting ATPase subunit KdpC [Bordetella pseudohinzii]ANY17359.1 K+-transporting ATPase subunit C [Bordetella pseudohinzii]KMM25574.1 potassium-transporting ATPase subunit C [Bordetella pseudohinzii]KXA75701.1 potassium-transporting ATPase subunit C [Bordetella pseudohinzii]KXA83183.1 potassium-transporting ATPase subunit C [Bordetella pseudohinzii]CUI69685.1 potassium-transporting ATPase subunit C [Bordetella pseudohinzii]